MKLSILIPTYNRSAFLLKNLNILRKYIIKGNFQEQIEIVISNNNSSDNSDEIIKNFLKENKNLNLNYYCQSSNIGLEKNTLQVLQFAKGEYVMFLGDDDFIDFDYLLQSIDYINSNPETCLVLPSIVEVDISDQFVKEGRDFKLSNNKHNAGFKNCLENSWRGHQLSGLILKREGLFKSYIQNNVKNIYPFIYFTAYCCLKGSTFHLTQFPVRVTNPGQKNKDWTYGEDGLINEMFDNYAKLEVNYLQKTQLQLEIIRRQPWRLWRYKKVSNKAFLNVFWNMLSSPNSTFLFKIIFPFEVIYIFLKKKIWHLYYS